MLSVEPQRHPIMRRCFFYRKGPRDSKPLKRPSVKIKIERLGYMCFATEGRQRAAAAYWIILVCLRSLRTVVIIKHMVSSNSLNRYRLSFFPLLLFSRKDSSDSKKQLPRKPSLDERRDRSARNKNPHLS